MEADKKQITSEGHGELALSALRERYKDGLPDSVVAVIEAGPRKVLLNLAAPEYEKERVDVRANLTGELTCCPGHDGHGWSHILGVALATATLNILVRDQRKRDELMKEDPSKVLLDPTKDSAITHLVKILEDSLDPAVRSLLAGLNGKDCPVRIRNLSAEAKPA